MILLCYGCQHIKLAPITMLQVLNLEGQLKTLHKAHEGGKLNLTQAIEACNFATKKRRAAERQLAKLQVQLSSLTVLSSVLLKVLIWLLMLVARGPLRLIVACIWCPWCNQLERFLCLSVLVNVCLSVFALACLSVCRPACLATRVYVCPFVFFKHCLKASMCDIPVQEAPQKGGGAKPESSALGNSLREYEALAKEVKVLRQAVDTRYRQYPHHIGFLAAVEIGLNCCRLRCWPQTGTRSGFVPRLRALHHESNCCEPALCCFKSYTPSQLRVTPQ